MVHLSQYLRQTVLKWMKISANPEYCLYWELHKFIDKIVLQVQVPKDLCVQYAQEEEAEEEAE